MNVLVRIQFRLPNGFLMEKEVSCSVEDLANRGLPSEILKAHNQVVNEVLGAKGVLIEKMGNHSNFINTIKAVREYSGLGLKEAKDIVEESKTRAIAFRAVRGTVAECIKEP